jgi:hypothetical protein
VIKIILVFSNIILSLRVIIKMILSGNQILVFLPVAMMFIVALGFVGLVMGVTHWMGPKRKSKVKLETFECGIERTGKRKNAVFYQIFSGSNIVRFIRCGSYFHVSLGG